VDLRAQLAVVRSWFLVIAAAAVLAGVTTYYLSGLLPKTYEARAKVLVGQTAPANPNAEQFQTAQNLADTYAVLATTGDFLQLVMDRANVPPMPLADFEKKVRVSTDGKLPFIDIVATDGTPKTAVAIAQAMADELIVASESITGEPQTPAFVERALSTTQRQIELTSARVNALQVDRDRTPAEETELNANVASLVSLHQTYAALLSVTREPPTNRLTVRDTPKLPTEPVSPRTLFNTYVSVILALLVATGVAFLWEKLDDRVRTPEDVERVAELPTIGTIIRMPSERGRKEFYRLATLLHPRSAAAEAFRTIRTNLEFASLDRPLRTITVRSSVAGEGKSVVGGNLAVAFAQAGRRTILIDADLRRPGLHELFAMPNDVGLTDMVLSDVMSLENVAQHTEEPNLWLVPSGAVPANPAELLGSQRMAVILQRILAEADLVILDTPPIGVVTDAALVAARTDATLLVVSPDRSSEGVVRKAREALAHVNARVVGAVLNNVSPRGAQANPYYGLHRGDNRSEPRTKPLTQAADTQAEATGSEVGPAESKP
jgi:polysaccharide biosynthesis transport protein